jgi:hypothetical protein
MYNNSTFATQREEKIIHDELDRDKESHKLHTWQFFGTKQVTHVHKF